MKRLAGLLGAACISLSLVVANVMSAAAQSTSEKPVPERQPTELTEAQRQAITSELINRFQGQVAQSPGGDVNRFAAKLTDVVATAEVANVLRATTMTSVSSMIAALNGQTPKISSSKAAAAKAGGTPTLGSTVADLVYTPLPNGRCRVADSRVIGAPIPGGVKRDLMIERIASYAGQGGNGTFANGDGSTNCGIPTWVSGIAVSVTLLNATANTVFKVFAYGKPFQTGNTVLVNSGSFGATGDLNVIACQNCTFDISIQGSGGTVDYVLDIVGYYMPPQATALDCTNVPGVASIVSAGAYAGLNAIYCPANYSAVSNSMSAASNVLQADSFVGLNYGQIFVKNVDTVARLVTPIVTCCRVPGR